MIPVALSGDRTYNKDTIRKYVISGNNTIPGASTIHFDEVSKDRIFHAIDKIKGIKTIIADSYRSLKDRLGREPLLIDFYEHGEVDPLLIIKEYNTYWQFMQSVARVDYSDKLNDQEKLILEYLSKTVISGVRPSELFLLKELYSKDFIPVKMLKEDLKKQYDYVISEQEITDCANVLQGCFVSKQEEYQKYNHMLPYILLDKIALNRLEH